MQEFKHLGSSTDGVCSGPTSRAIPHMSLLASTALTAPPQISVVIPCLNEEEAVGKVVDQALEGIRRSGRSGEVVVVDNASTDRSAEVATAHGAIVVSEPRRG